MQFSTHDISSDVHFLGFLNHATEKDLFLSREIIFELKLFDSSPIDRKIQVKIDIFDNNSKFVTL